MPVPVNVPGVTIREIPSGPVTITGVATSITAFVGRTPMGPTEPLHCRSFGDFNHFFGGRALDYPLTYAVEDFFQNGGNDALIVRIYKAPEPAKDDRGNTTTNNDGRAALPALNLVAANQGAWGNALAASIDYADLPQGRGDRYNLTLTYTKSDGTRTVERFAGVTTQAGTRSLARVLAQSELARVAVDATGAPTIPVGGPEPTATLDQHGKPTQDEPLAFTGGADTGTSGGDALTADDIVGKEDLHTGIHALRSVDLFNLMCIPPDRRNFDDAALVSVYQRAALYCLQRRAMLIMDPPAAWSARANAGRLHEIQPTDLQINGPQFEARNCAVYFPRITKANQEIGGAIEVVPACGAIAGIFAANDMARGVWKAPAGITAGIRGIAGLEIDLTDDQNGMLELLGINCLRSFPTIGPVVWGARTLRGADVLQDDYKYIPVRRLALYIEESLYSGTQFAVFEPNDAPLWSRLRLISDAFMADLYRQGAFYDYQVRCDGTTTTPADVARGVVNVIVAFAPVKPAEFILLQLQQRAGQTPGSATAT